MQVQAPLSNLQAPVDNSSLPKGAASFPNTPPARVNKLALAIFVVLSTALLAAGVYLSLQALIIIGSFSSAISAAALVFNFSLSSSSQTPKNVNKAEEFLDQINSNTTGAQSSIKSISFWNGLSKDEDKKAVIRAWLGQGKSLEEIPFEKLNPSILVLAYEVIKESPDLGDLKAFCQRYRCLELIEKMTLQELYVQEGLNVKALFAKDQDTKLDWERWQEFKDFHAKFILCILLDSKNFADESKRESVNHFVSNLFKKIGHINLIEDKEISLFNLLYITKFDFAEFVKQTNNRSLALKYGAYYLRMNSQRGQ
ncbi:hypothetical protein [Criblamydia sequanensis]|uniref:Membrane protein n=1 Tax=Candidatus Criblamydia sequanensis CRIB-18 TaxID=1437425 RepID=A0A090CZ95_9BACT|nr:hypothetical protein [Criblamydia sequanensis]CDR34131.1 putative membrane protein [Criblamydia sequanensis CRIB-18]